MSRKYGRIPPQSIHPRRFLAHLAITPKLPEPPPSVDYTSGGAAYAGMLGNDRAGDCTIAGLYHLLQGWAAANGRQFAATDAEAIGVYSGLSGYDPSSGANDTGLVETDVLDYWERTGVPTALPADASEVNRISGYTACPLDVDHIKQTIYAFGGIYLGLQIPRSAEQQTDAHQPWTVPWYSPIVGGHCVVAQKYDETFLWVDTWGLLQPVTWSFVFKYFDAAYAVFNPAWLTSGKAPNGLDAATLTADLTAVAS